MDLPPEIWLRIFSYLDDPRFLEPLSLVSKQFLTLTNSLYATLSLKDPATQFLPSLFLRFNNINSINLSCLEEDPTSILLQIPLYYPHLRSLSLCSHQNLPLEAFRQIGHQMKGLKVLDISELGVLVIVADCFPYLEELDIYFPNRFSVTDAGISALSLKLKNLNKINIAGFHSITDTSIIALSINCVFLKNIVIWDCGLVTPNGIDCLLKNRPELDALDVDGIANGSQIQHISQAISFECARCLGSLDLCHLLVPDEWLFLIGKCRFPLKSLGLSFSHGFSIEGLMSVLRKHLKIEHLDCRRVDFLTDNAISVLSGFLSDLVSVNLSFCTKLTSMAFYYLTRACPLLKKVRMVRVFMSEEEDLSMHYEINSQVRSLYLYGGYCLSDQCLKKFVMLCPNLQFLDVGCCPKLSEEAILFIMKRCSRIAHIKIAGCNMKDLGINFDVPSLEILCARGTKLNGEAIAAIGKRCRNLRRLDLSECINVSTDVVKAVVEICKELREIDVQGCKQLDADIVPWMVLTRPSLRKICPPRGFKPREAQRNFFLRHGCLVYEAVGGN